ncbi:MAG: hypothetical protein RLY86_96 [Pseudomonadota bacterium]|jgi:enoyl-CoA hydratase
MTEDVLCTVSGGVGLITLNRPKALNALTLDMIRVIDPQLRAWAADPAVHAVVIRGAGDRAFCAGGDVRAVWDAGRAMQAGAVEGLTRAFFFEEYRLNRRIKTFPKPYIALIDGITMGGGVGLSVHGSHRVTTEKTLFAMPETGIGLIPDVGGTYFLPRLPGHMGRYLGLTGARLQAGDLHYLGLATAHVPADRLDALVADLTAADWAAAADPHKRASDLIATHEVAVDPPTLPALRGMIDRCFAHDTVEAVLEDLETMGLEAEGSGIALATARIIRTMSPTSLKLTLEQLRRGAELTFDDAMKLEFAVVQRIMRGHDFYEGIRAVLVDKDRSPKWQPADMDGVGAADVLAHFAPPADGGLHFED